MKIIFLDMDGVVNSEKWAHETYEKQGHVHMTQQVDEKAVAHLNTVIEKTGAKVVISSSWRIIMTPDEIWKVLKDHGFKGEVIGKTPNHTRNAKMHARGYEIQDWLEDNEGKVESFVIIDDSDDMEHLLPYLVRTTWLDGLQEEHVEPIVKMLGGV